MTMWTELFVACKLKYPVPDDVRDVLNHLFFNMPVDEQNIPNHPFFQNQDWKYFIQAPGIAPGSFFEGAFGHEGFSIRTEHSTHSAFQIYEFLHWIAPYSSSGTSSEEVSDNYYEYYPAKPTFVGYINHEGEDHPFLIYFYDGKAYLSKHLLPDLEPIEPFKTVEQRIYPSQLTKSNQKKKKPSKG